MNLPPMINLSEFRLRQEGNSGLVLSKLGWNIYFSLGSFSSCFCPPPPLPEVGGGEGLSLLYANSGITIVTSFVAIVLKDQIMKDGKDKLILIFGLIIAFLLSSCFIILG